jgi:thioredoxin-related protein
MKRFLSALLLITLSTSLGHTGDTTELKWRKLDDGIAEAKKSNKKILLDVYTDWCKWCKKLDTEVYVDPKVAEYLSKAYIPVKLNAESGAKVNYKGKNLREIDIAQVFGVNSYPTIIFLDSKGEPIDRLGGFVDAERFLPIIKFIGTDAYKKMSWEDYQKKNAAKQ